MQRWLNQFAKDLSRYDYLNSCDDLTQIFLEGRMDSRTYAMRLDERMWMAERKGVINCAILTHNSTP